MKDDQGGEWRVDIFDTQWSGAVDSLTLSGEGFKVQWDGDIRNKVNPIITSSATIEFVMQDEADENIMTLIAGNVEGRFSVAIYQMIATVPILYWTGTVLTDQVSYLDEYYPIRAEITASDDIGALQDVPYDDDGTPYASNQSKTVIGHVHEALLKLRQVERFYTSSSQFLIYANDFYSVDDDVSVTDHLNSTVIYNLTWNNPDDEGNNQIVSAYDVLESICKTYNARLFQYSGFFRFMPIGAYQNDQENIDCERLLFDGTSSTSFTDSLIDKSVGTGLNKLRGWRFEFYQPYKFTERTQIYYGNTALAADNAYDMIVADTISDADIDYPASQLLKISGIINGSHTNDGTTYSGANRIGRFVAKITLKVGSYYLQRDITYSGTNEIIFFDEGTASEYTTAQYGATSWTTTPSTFDSISATFDLNGFYDDPVHGAAINLDLILPQLPSDLSGLDFTCEMYAVNASGTETLAANPPYSGQITSLRVDWVENGLTNGDTLTWTAQGQDSNRNTLSQGDVLIGDAVSANSRGVLYVIGSSGEQQSTGWRSLNVISGTLSIHRLGVQEVQAMHNITSKGVQGQLYSDLISPHQLLKDNGEYYMATSMAFNANSRITEWQGFKLTRDTTDISSDSSGRGDVSNPVIGTGSNSGTLPTSPLEPAGGGAVDSVNGVSPVSGDVTIDSDDIDYTGTGGGSITSAIGANTSNIDTLKSYVVSSTDKVELKEDTNNKIEVDGTSAAEKVTITVAGTEALEIDDVSASFSGLVKSNGIELINLSDSLIMKDSAGDRWRIQIQTDGTLRTTKL
jgi:hypothetical protein